MKTITLPYGRTTVEMHLPEERLLGILAPHTSGISSGGNEEEIVRESLENPIGSPRLRDLARGARHILLITSDHTRPVPSRITLPLLLSEIRRSNPQAEIRILIATGLHRRMTQEELAEKFGPEIAEHETILPHDCRDTKHLVKKGTLPSGGELWLNDLVDWADLVAAEGFIEPHFFAGFSGGRKSILPGIAGDVTVRANHCAGFIADPACRTGNLGGNPIHRDMLYASGQAGLRFILNVVLDSEKRILRSFAGDPEEAHRAGCAFSASATGIRAVPAGIVVVTNGGYPLDQNIYQTVKGMSAAEATVQDGGIIIMVAACEDGHGGEAFFRWFADGGTPREILRRISAIPPDQTLPDQWQAQILARILCRCRVILVTDRCPQELITGMGMEWAATPDDALRRAFACMPVDTGVTVIPDGVSVIVNPVEK